VKNDPTFWLLARASGLTAYLLLTLSILAGLILKSRPFGRAVKAASVMDVHRLFALLGLASLGVHGTALLLDKTVKMPVAGLFVPGSSPYRPVSVAFGVIAAELMFLVVVSFSIRKLIGQKRWRLLHWSTYGIFALATAHGLLAGSDSAQPWARDVYLAAAAAVVFATSWRALYKPTASAQRRAVTSVKT
jgi:DMSO/TMAO reductase YedYZ heme-binding membrane subunit